MNGDFLIRRKNEKPPDSSALPGRCRGVRWAHGVGGREDGLGGVMVGVCGFVVNPIAPQKPHPRVKKYTTKLGKYAI